MNRPRCRDFVPLITNQLRLRNLVQIKICNLQCQQKSQIYFTLHSTSMSSPIYTSEKIDIQSNLIEWPEIISETIIRSASQSVCIRVWLHNCDNSSNKTSDKILFLWGVYFSGLVLIPKQNNIKLRKNTLIFCMNGGSFTSADYILTDDDMSNSSIPDNKSNCDYSNSLSDRNSTSSSFNFLSCAKFSPQFSIDSSNYSDGQSIRSITEIMEESRYFKVRYVELTFSNSEIRPSYNVDKLLTLQDRQRILKRCQNDSKLLIDRICRKSAYCLNLELFANKPFFYEAPKKTSMGRTLDRLLHEQQAPPKPEVLMKAQELRRKIEYAKFRCRFLHQERERRRLKNRELEIKRDKIKDENTELDSFLMNGYHKMRKEKDKHFVDEKSFKNQEDNLRNFTLALQETRRNILRELNDIYRIHVENGDKFMINNIYVPFADKYTSAELGRNISVALGFVAHAVLICSRILNVPLRNAIKHDGSRSKIICSVVSSAQREFPLHCRVSPPPNEVMYAIYLLNQNITQLKFYSQIKTYDLKATLANLWDLLNKYPVIYQKFVKEHKRVDGSHTDEASRASSMEISIPDPPYFDYEFSFKPRISKSLTDLDKEILKDNTRQQFNSEPILSNGRENDIDNL